MNERVQTPRRADDPAAATNPVRFGVLAPTSMVAAQAVVPALESTANAEIVATASRTGGDDYASVIEHPDVEAVYVPLPNGLHREWVERCAAGGKHVLCEKPLALTADDAVAMARACDDAGVVLMEAYMTPFHPRTVAVADLVNGGRIGRPRSIRAVFTFPHRNPDDHRWDPELGGGALADLGIYVLTPLFELAAGRGVPVPERMAISTVMAPSGVDATTTGFLGFPDGFSASFEASFEQPERQLLEVAGTTGRLVVDRQTFTPGPADTTIELWDADGDRAPLFTPGGDAYRGMIDHFCAVVRGRGALRRPPAVSIAFAQLLDRLRDER